MKKEEVKKIIRHGKMKNKNKKYLNIQASNLPINLINNSQLDIHETNN